MSFKMDHVHVWACEVKTNQEGRGQAEPAGRSRCRSGIRLHTRLAEKPGFGVLCVAGDGMEQTKAAKSNGMHEVPDPIVMRVEGDNTAGLAPAKTRVGVGRPESARLDTHGDRQQVRWLRDLR